MARATCMAGVHDAIGLQLRASPAVAAVCKRLRSGAIGRLLSISGFSSTAGFGPDLAARRPSCRRRARANSFEAGTPFAIEVAGGRMGNTAFYLDIVGDEGVLRLKGALRGLQSGRIALLSDGERVAVDEGDFSTMPDAAVNVAGVYAELRDAIIDGTPGVHGFDHAVGLTRMIEAVLKSSAEGCYVTAHGWEA